MQAIARNLRISYKKANLVAGLVRKKNAEYALAILAHTQKKASGMLSKVIASAIANAKNNYKQDTKDLYIKEIIVTEGMTMKRSVPISRGRMHPILKRTCHITIKLEVKKEEKETKQDAKDETKKELNQDSEAKTEKETNNTVKTTVKTKKVTKKESKAKQ